MNNDKTHLFDKRRNVRFVLRALYTICAVLFVVDFVYQRHVVDPVESIWGFYAVYGFVACVLLVLVAKEMRKLLMRGEDYYDDR